MQPARRSNINTKTAKETSVFDMSCMAAKQLAARNSRFVYPGCACACLLATEPGDERQRADTKKDVSEDTQICATLLK